MNNGTSLRTRIGIGSLMVMVVWKDAEGRQDLKMLDLKKALI